MLVHRDSAADLKKLLRESRPGPGGHSGISVFPSVNELLFRHRMISLYTALFKNGEKDLAQLLWRGGC
jgi:hypothetical protein